MIYFFILDFLSHIYIFLFKQNFQQGRFIINVKSIDWNKI